MKEDWLLFIQEEPGEPRHLLGMPRKEMTSQNTSFKNNFWMTPLLIMTIVLLDALKNLLRLKGALNRAQGRAAAEQAGVWCSARSQGLWTKCGGRRRAAGGGRRPRSSGDSALSSAARMQTSRPAAVSPGGRGPGAGMTGCRPTSDSSVGPAGKRAPEVPPAPPYEVSLIIIAKMSCD